MKKKQCGSSLVNVHPAACHYKALIKRYTYIPTFSHKCDPVQFYRPLKMWSVAYLVEVFESQQMG